MGVAAPAAGKLTLSLVGGLLFYAAFFVVAPALHDPTSALRLRASELADEFRAARDEIRAVIQFRSELDQIERMVNE